MPLYVWSRELEVGVGEIDSQHRRIFEACNALHAALMAGEGARAVGEALSFAVRYAEAHFRAEENEMVRTGFPDYGAHRRSHGELLTRAYALLARQQAEGPVCALEACRFIGDWLRTHIGKEDRGFVHYLRARRSAGAGADSSSTQR